MIVIENTRKYKWNRVVPNKFGRYPMGRPRPATWSTGIELSPTSSRKFEKHLFLSCRDLSGCNFKRGAPEVHKTSFRPTEIKWLIFFFSRIKCKLNVVSLMELFTKNVEKVFILLFYNKKPRWNWCNFTFSVSSSTWKTFPPTTATA